MPTKSELEANLALVEEQLENAIARAEDAEAEAKRAGARIEQLEAELARRKLSEAESIKAHAQVASDLKRAEIDRDLYMDTISTLRAAAPKTQSASFQQAGFQRVNNHILGDSFLVWGFAGDDLRDMCGKFVAVRPVTRWLHVLSGDARYLSRALECVRSKC